MGGGHGGALQGAPLPAMGRAGHAQGIGGLKPRALAPAAGRSPGAAGRRRRSTRLRDAWPPHLTRPLSSSGCPCAQIATQQAARASQAAGAAPQGALVRGGVGGARQPQWGEANLTSAARRQSPAPAP